MRRLSALAVLWLCSGHGASVGRAVRCGTGRLHMRAGACAVERLQVLRQPRAQPQAGDGAASCRPTRASHPPGHCADGRHLCDEATAPLAAFSKSECGMRRSPAARWSQAVEIACRPGPTRPCTTMALRSTTTCTADAARPATPDTVAVVLTVTTPSPCSPSPRRCTGRPTSRATTSRRSCSRRRAG